jgi:hypothetical protein
MTTLPKPGFGFIGAAMDACISALLLSLGLRINLGRETEFRFPELLLESGKP